MKALLSAFLFLILTGCAFPNINIDDNGFTDLPKKPVDAIRLHTFNVGVGSCHLLECANGIGPILYDCGSSGLKTSDRSLDRLRRKINKVLENTDHPLRIVISHAHLDHTNLLNKLIVRKNGQSWLGRSKVGFIWYSDEIEEKSYTNNIYKAINQLENTKDYYFSPWHGKKVIKKSNKVNELSCGLAPSYVLAANIPRKHSWIKGKNAHINATSINLLISNGPDANLLLTGDAVDKTQEAVQDNIKDFGSEVKSVTTLVSPHHGASSNGSNDGNFANSVKPKSIIYSAGNWYGHPRCKSVANYQDHLMPAKKHDFSCSKAGIVGVPWFNSKETTTKAEYVTKESGDIITTILPNSLEFKCSEDPTC